jgi:hypothetical protein
MIKFIFSVAICLVISSCAMSPSTTTKINGVSYVGTRDSLLLEHVEPLKNNFVNYTSLMPFGFIRDQSHPEIIFNTERQWFGEKGIGIRQYAEMLRKEDINIMLKPQIWIRRGEFTGHLQMETEAAWQQLEHSYETYILEHARLAEALNLPIFCIGTELERFIKFRPEYWQRLIKKIKHIYKGKLTYAANWDEYQTTPFWNELDYIGVNGYFPLTEEQTPSVETCKIALEQWKVEMKQFSSTQNKPILFTEFGYRSVDFAAKQPWRSDRDMTAVNLAAQTNASLAFFETFWYEDWVAGGFIWKWFPNHEASGGIDDSRFTPQNKPAELILKSVYSGI